MKYPIGYRQKYPIGYRFIAPSGNIWEIISYNKIYYYCARIIKSEFNFDVMNFYWDDKGIDTCKPDKIWERYQKLRKVYMKYEIGTRFQYKFGGAWDTWEIVRHDPPRYRAVLKINNCKFHTLGENIGWSEAELQDKERVIIDIKYIRYEKLRKVYDQQKI